MSLLLDPEHGTAMCSDFPVLDAQDQRQQVAGLFKCASQPQKFMMWLVMHVHGFSGMKDANQPNYTNKRKINALAMLALFLARTCQNLSSKHILNYNCIQFMGGTMLPSLIKCRDEHPSLQDLHHMQNSMPTIKHFEIRRTGQHVCNTAWRCSLHSGLYRDPFKSLTWVHESKVVLKAVFE